MEPQTLKAKVIRVEDISFGARQRGSSTNVKAWQGHRHYFALVVKLPDVAEEAVIDLTDVVTARIRSRNHAKLGESLKKLKETAPKGSVLVRKFQSSVRISTSELAEWYKRAKFKPVRSFI